MSKPSTPISSGTGLNDAQAAIENLLTGEYADTQDGENTSALPEGEEGDDLDLDIDDEDGDHGAGEAEDDSDPADGGSDPDDEGADDGEPELPATVDIDGTAVPLEELKKGYLRQSDYTRKTQELAEQRKTLAEQHTVLSQERQQYAVLLPVLARMVETGGQQEPDWDTLFQQDPIGAVQQKHQWDRQMAARREMLAAVQAEQQRLQETEQREQFEALSRTVAEERTKLLEKLPRWKDPAVAKAEREQVKQFALTLGFTPEELNAVTDHRAVYGLYMAMKYARLESRKAELTPKSTVRPMKPGAAPAGKADLRRKAVVAQKQRLAKTGDVRDAASLIEKLL